MALSEKTLSAFDAADDATKQAILAKLGPAAAKFQEKHASWKSSQVPAQQKSTMDEIMDVYNAAGRGLEQGATLGFGDEIRGAGGALGMGPTEQLLSMSPLAPTIWATRGGQALYNLISGKSQGGPGYVATRDANRELDKRAREGEYSAAYGAGDVAGALATSALPIGSVAGVGKAALTGAGYGAAAGLGASESDSVTDVAKDALGSGLVGAVLGPLGYLGTKAAGALSKSLGQGAEKRAFKAYQPALKDETLYSEVERMAIGRRALDEDILSLAGSPEAMAKKAEPLKERAGQEIGAALKEIDAAVGGQPVNPEQLAAHLETTVLPRFKGPADRDLRAMLASEIDEIRKYGKYGKLTFSEAEEVLKRPLQNKAKFDQAVPARSTGALQQLSGALREELEMQIAGKAPDDLFAKYKGAKKRYGEIAPGEKMAERAADRERKNSPVGLYDVIAGAGALGATGDPKAALATTIALRVLRRGGNATTAVLMDELSKALGNKAAQQITKNLVAKGLVTEVGPSVSEEVQNR